tara:strand:+ start:1293 stop:1913 length:621 start_codon:yes stop_codon:yes gene_type:complete
MPYIKKLLPYVFYWSEFSKEKQLNFNGYLICSERESVIIDPPALPESGLRELNFTLSENNKFPLKAILLTNMDHVRSSHKFKKYYSIPIFINKNDAIGIDISADKTFKDGDDLFCNLRVIQLDNQKTQGDTAFFLESKKLLILGDSLIGNPPGKVRLLPTEKYQDIYKAKNSLKILLNFNFDKLLLGDGEPNLVNAKSCVEDFLNS